MPAFTVMMAYFPTKYIILNQAKDLEISITTMIKLNWNVVENSYQIAYGLHIKKSVKIH